MDIRDIYQQDQIDYAQHDARFARQDAARQLPMATSLKRHNKNNCRITNETNTTDNSPGTPSIALGARYHRHNRWCIHRHELVEAVKRMPHGMCAKWI